MFKIHAVLCNSKCLCTLATKRVSSVFITFFEKRVSDFFFFLTSHYLAISAECSAGPLEDSPIKCCRVACMDVIIQQARTIPDPWTISTQGKECVFQAFKVADGPVPDGFGRRIPPVRPFPKFLPSFFLPK